MKFRDEVGCVNEAFFVVRLFYLIFLSVTLKHFLMLVALLKTAKNQMEMLFEDFSSGN